MAKKRNPAAVGTASGAREDVLAINEPQNSLPSQDEKLQVFRLTGRECGSCSLCCKLLRIDELSKPANRWCRHCRPGNSGCTIYDARPPVCRGFYCEWLLEPKMGDEWRPTRAKMVVCREGEDTIFNVDPDTPTRWREAPYYTQIKTQALAGLHRSSGTYFHTYVRVGERLWLILPDQNVELTGFAAHVVSPGGPGGWEVLGFTSMEDARQYIEKVNKIRAKLGIAPRRGQP
jgi:hypothetical protein